MKLAISTPCHHCDNHSAECHSICQEYIDWKIEHDKTKEIIIHNRKVDCTVSTAPKRRNK